MLSQLLPNYLPFASNMALKWNVSIEIIHFVVIILAVIAALLIIEFCKVLLSSILVVIACIISFGLVAVFGVAAIPIILIGILGFLLGKWIYNKIRRRQLSGKIWNNFNH